MLSLMLGSGTNVVALRKDQTKVMKTNYHRFRNRAGEGRVDAGPARLDCLGFQGCPSFGV